MRKGQIAECNQGHLWLVEGPEQDGLIPVSNVINPAQTYLAPVQDLTLIPGLTRR